MAKENNIQTPGILNPIFDDIFRNLSAQPKITEEDIKRSTLQDWLLEVYNISPLALQQEIYQFVCNYSDALYPILEAVNMRNGEIEDGREMEQ